MVVFEGGNLELPEHPGQPGILNAAHWIDGHKEIAPRVVVVPQHCCRNALLGQDRLDAFLQDEPLCIVVGRSH